MSTESVMPCNHLIPCRPHLLPSVFPSFLEPPYIPAAEGPFLTLFICRMLPLMYFPWSLTWAALTLFPRPGFFPFMLETASAFPGGATHLTPHYPPHLRGSSWLISVLRLRAMHTAWSTSAFHLL